MKIWNILFELIQVEVQCHKNYFKNFLPQEPGAFENKIEKELQKPLTELKKKMYIIYLRQYLLSQESNVRGNFLQKSINFVEQRPKFSHFEGSIIP